METKRIFSLVGIIINLRTCHLQTKKFKLIFVNKIWFNDPKIGCKSPSNLLDFLERDINVAEEL